MSVLNTLEISAFLERQVDPLFQLYLKEKSSALGVFLANGRSQIAATNTKYEWLEGQLTPLTFTVNATHATGTFDPSTPGNLTLVSTANLEVGTILRFTRGADAVPVGNMQLKIQAISSGTVATATIYGGSTDVALATNDVAVIVSKPRAENEKSFNEDKGWKPDTAYNYTQIFRENVDISDTVLNSMVYGNFQAVSRQLEGVFYKIEKQMSEQMWMGLRVQRSSTENGSFGGLDSFVNISGGNVIDASAGALTMAMINNGVEQIYRDGGIANTIICGTKRARQISAFNVGTTNPIIDQASRDAGSYVSRFISDLPIIAGSVTNILLDPTLPSDRIYLADSSRVSIVPYANRGLAGQDASVNGQDGMTALLRGEYTMKVEDGKYSHAVIKNLG